jgi:aldehyde dehydrogenase (NAD+)
MKASSSPAAAAPDDTAPAAVDPAAVVQRLRTAFASGRTQGRAWREFQLQRLQALLRDAEADLLAALRLDLGKSEVEAWAGEINFVGGEIAHTLAHLGKWMRPERVSVPAVFRPGRAYVQREPLGVVLIISPWNYPLQLMLGPLVGAIAAGNCAVLKPSEMAPHTAARIAELLPRYLDPECFAVVEGDIPATQALLAQRFDHIFYTGNGRVGRIVMEAAARHLTPVTLELGGKSPCIVDRSADIEVSARRIVWGKFFNAGQTCVAPDYVLAHREVIDPLCAAMVRQVRALYGDDPRRSGDYGRIVNERHLRRLEGLLDQGTRVCGGEVDPAERYIAPTILRDVPADAPVMADEIFGPILPVLAVNDLSEAVSFVNQRDKPLALYVFAGDGQLARGVIERTSSGGACINEVLVHLNIPELPFGGVGPSGMGAYHGRHSFETFSHRKSVLERPTILDLKLRYPPFDERKTRWLRRLA